MHVFLGLVNTQVEQSRIPQSLAIQWFSEQVVPDILHIHHKLLAIYPQ